MPNPEDRFEICHKRRAILGGTGHMLILGGPGSGMTTIALLKARRTVLERLQPEQSVLFLSFSNSAIRRILESAGSVLKAGIGRQVEIKTYHSFAWDILKSHGYLLSLQRNMTIISAQDTAVIRAGLTDEVWTAEEERLLVDEGRLTYASLLPVQPTFLSVRPKYGWRCSARCPCRHRVHIALFPLLRTVEPAARLPDHRANCPCLQIPDPPYFRCQYRSFPQIGETQMSRTNNQSHTAPNIQHHDDEFDDAILPTSVRSSSSDSARIEEIFEQGRFQLQQERNDFTLPQILDFVESNLPKTLRDRHLHLCGRALQTVYEGISGRRVNYQEIARRLGTCVEGSDTFELNKECFTLFLGNCTSRRVADMLDSAGVAGNVWDEAGRDAELKKHFGGSGVRETSKLASRKLDEYIRVRNGIVHRGELYRSVVDSELQDTIVLFFAYSAVQYLSTWIVLVFAEH